MGNKERRITGQCSAADIKAMIAFLKVGGKPGSDVKPKHALALVVIAKFSRARIPINHRQLKQAVSADQLL